MKNLCRILSVQTGQVQSWARVSSTVKLAIAATLFLLIGTAVICTVQLESVPPETSLSINDGHNAEVYPTQKCEAAWFPARHWARPSPKYFNFSEVQAHHGQQMYGTVVAQHAIWKHQHPRACHDKKFLVYEALGRDHGIGSVVHVLSVALQAALNLNRILVLVPQPNFEWVQGKFCAGMDTLDDCYFEPLSSCTIVDAMADGQDVAELSEETYKRNSERVLRSAVGQMGSNLLPFLMRDTPLMFHSLLKRGGVYTEFYYWWRAQSSAYIVRPTLRTLRELDRRRGAVFKGGRIDPGTVSVHVRHGDKWKEAKLEGDATFLRKAEELLMEHDVEPSTLQRKMFLSTEDPNTVKFFAHLSNWTVQYTNVKRVGDPNVGPEDFAAKIGWDEEFLNSLLSLELALECDGFVGAIASNWNRLIDELRSTVHVAMIQMQSVYRFLDKGAVRPPEEASGGPKAGEGSRSASPWEQCTVTQVEEVKLLVRCCPSGGRISCSRPCLLKWAPCSSTKIDRFLYTFIPCTSTSFCDEIARGERGISSSSQELIKMDQIISVGEPWEQIYQAPAVQTR